MVIGFTKAHHQEVAACELKSLLDAGEALVVDVREADEFSAGHIPGAVNVPLSGFDPLRLPDAAGKLLVLNCLGGKRSGMALDRCAAARAAVDTHLAGGFSAWTQAGFPTAR